MKQAYIILTSSGQKASPVYGILENLRQEIKARNGTSEVFCVKVAPGRTAPLLQLLQDLYAKGIERLFFIKGQPLAGDLVKNELPEVLKKFRGGAEKADLSFVAGHAAGI